MTKFCRTYLLLTVLLILASCARGTDSLPEPLLASKYPISWTVHLEQGLKARALVDDGVLQSSCTTLADGTNESIGLWGQYTLEVDGQNKTSLVFEDTPLTYDMQEGGTYAWDNPGNDRFWELQSVYDFRACYPQILMTSLMTEKSATAFRGSVNTQEVQEDILVTALQVDAKTANLNETVPLNMKHIFAAIKFKVKAADGFTPASGEGITSCWLQNLTDATNLFSPSGELEHEGNSSPIISWETDESTTAPMYLWKHEGISFITENTLYTSIDGGVGNVYTNNDGGLLVIPQQVSAETLKFCFTMKTAGNKVFSVNMPAVTYEPGQQYTYLLEISGSDIEPSLVIQPWNEKNISQDINVTKKPVFKLDNGPIKARENVKDGALYLIYNRLSGKYLYANSNTMKVEAGSSYGQDDAVDPSYVWKFDRVNQYYYHFWVESMGCPGYNMQCTQVNNTMVPLAENPTSSDIFTISTASNGLRLRLTSDQIRFLAVNGETVYGYPSSYSDTTHDFYLYEVIQQE